jgi:integrase
VTPTGTKTFQYYSWVKNHGPVTITVGRFPRVNLVDARKKAVELAGEISLRGKAVIEDLQSERLEQTFADLFESWFKDQQTMGKRDLNNVRSRYDNHIKPTLGNKRPSALTEKYLTSWFLRLPNRKKSQGSGTISNTTANRCMEIVSAVFASKASINPAATIKHFPEESRERYLSGDELASLFEALDHKNTPEELRDIVLLALTTGARKMNILSMKWNDVDLTNMLWVIPAAVSKNKRSMGVPLIPEAVDILKRRKKAAKSIFVFPSSGKKGHVVDIRRAWSTLLDKAGIADFVFHDLRRTAGSWQAHIGSSDIIIGKSLGHSSTQSTRIYARIRDNNPVRNSLAGGFAAMVEASKKKKVVNIGGK